MNYCRGIRIYFLFMEFLSKIGLSDVSFVVLIEHSKSLAQSKQAIRVEDLLVNLGVLVNAKLHLEEVAELELLWSIGLRVIFRVLFIIVILLLGYLIFLYFLMISTGGAIFLESTTENRGSCLYIITLALLGRILFDLSGSQVEPVLLS